MLSDELGTGYHEKMIGYCSDEGMIQLLKNNKKAPWIIPMWCLAHRLELAIKDCFEKTYFSTVSETLGFNLLFLQRFCQAQ